VHPGHRFLTKGETDFFCQLTMSSLQLMHPVLESLRSTDRQWLIDTLYAFNSGNVERFQTLKTAWGQQPDLAANEAQLLRKIQLLCLMEMTFTRPANHRQLTFEEIAKSAKITVNEVQLLDSGRPSGKAAAQRGRSSYKLPRLQTTEDTVSFPHTLGPWGDSHHPSLSRWSCW